jgi:hypothetical protein
MSQELMHKLRTRGLTFAVVFPTVVYCLSGSRLLMMSLGLLLGLFASDEFVRTTMRYVHAIVVGVVSESIINN